MKSIAKLVVCGLLFFSALQAHAQHGAPHILLWAHAPVFLAVDYVDSPWIVASLIH
jgi:hypothetical protein